MTWVTLATSSWCRARTGLELHNHKGGGEGRLRVFPTGKSYHDNRPGPGIRMGPLLKPPLVVALSLKE